MIELSDFQKDTAAFVQCCKKMRNWQCKRPAAPGRRNCQFHLDKMKRETHTPARRASQKRYWDRKKNRQIKAGPTIQPPEEEAERQEGQEEKEEQVAGCHPLFQCTLPN